jgi:di/tripeptidase
MNAPQISEDLTDRIIRYCEIDTGSIEGVKNEDGTLKVPSTPGQRVFAELLAQEASAMGYQVDFLDAGLRVRAKATKEGIVPIMMGAHLDTSEEAPSKDIEVIVHENYQGQNLVLKDDVVISPQDKGFEKLNEYKGDTLFTSNGKTLLGGDDKAGAAGLMTFLKYLKETGEDHGDIDVFFTYDEETGLEGASLIDPEKDTNAKYGFVFDNADGDLGVNSFNAASAYLELPQQGLDQEFTGEKVTVTLNGISTFPGHGKDEGMIDAYRNLPGVAAILEDAGAVITNIQGSSGKIELEVLVSDPKEIAALSKITDTRFDPAKLLKEGKNVVDVKYHQEQGSSSQTYHLGELVGMVNDIPYEMSAEQTEGIQGYIQPLQFKVLDGKLFARTLLRDFETDGLEAKRELIRRIAPSAEIKEEYMNKAEILAENPQVIDAAVLAMERAGVTNVKQTEVRGGDESGVYTLSVKTMTGESEPGRRIPSVNVGIMGPGIHTKKECLALGAVVRGFKTMVELNRMAVNGYLN